MSSSDKYFPHPQREQAATRKELFQAINTMVMKSGDSWLTSIPGARDVALEVLPSSVLPSELAALGYRLVPEPDGQRMLATPIVESVKLEGSSIPLVVRHAGIVTVERYSFRLP